MIAPCPCGRIHERCAKDRRTLEQRLFDEALERRYPERWAEVLTHNAIAIVGDLADVFEHERMDWRCPEHGGREYAECPVCALQHSKREWRERQERQERQGA